GRDEVHSDSGGQLEIAADPQIQRARGERDHRDPDEQERPDGRLALTGPTRKQGDDHEREPEPDDRLDPYAHGHVAKVSAAAAAAATAVAVFRSWQVWSRWMHRPPGRAYARPGGDSVKSPRSPPPPCFRVVVRRWYRRPVRDPDRILDGLN